jgi:hypothetical protein
MARLLSQHPELESTRKLHSHDSLLELPLKVFAVIVKRAPRFLQEGHSSLFSPQISPQNVRNLPRKQDSAQMSRKGASHWNWFTILLLALALTSTACSCYAALLPAQEALLDR